MSTLSIISFCLRNIKQALSKILNFETFYLARETFIVLHLCETAGTIEYITRK